MRHKGQLRNGHERARIGRGFPNVGRTDESSLHGSKRRRAHRPILTLGQHIPDLGLRPYAAQSGGFAMRDVRRAEAWKPLRHLEELLSLWFLPVC
ncbi:hypothetical protein D3C84_894080 [compost metagenome]